MTNQTKFKTVSVCTEAEAKASVNDPRFLSFTRLDSDIYEVKCSKQSICYDLPLHIGIFVYGYAKLVLLRCYFEFLDHFFSRRDFALIQCDTDSLYFSISVYMTLSNQNCETNTDSVCMTGSQPLLVPPIIIFSIKEGGDRVVNSFLLVTKRLLVNSN